MTTSQGWALKAARASATVLAVMTWWQKWWLGLRRNVAQSLSVSLAAGVGSTPLTAFHFGLVTPISVFAGLFLIPLVFVLLSAALFAVALLANEPSSPGLQRWLEGEAGQLLTSRWSVVEIASASNTFEMSNWMGDSISRISRDVLRADLPSILVMELAKVS